MRVPRLTQASRRHRDRASELGIAFKRGIDFSTDWLDDFTQIADRLGDVVRLAPFLKQGRPIFLGISEGNFRCEEANTLWSLAVDKLSNTAAKHCDVLHRIGERCMHTQPKFADRQAG
jgi:hypothetical protein